VDEGVIGLTGNTGGATDGPHLHFSVKKDGKYINTFNFLVSNNISISFKKGRYPFDLSRLSRSLATPDTGKKKIK
jgi:murein DD-endopeptidase MepM/ murein hydrolase activator NlpD